MKNKQAAKGKGSGGAIPKIVINKALTEQQGADLLHTLAARFAQHMDRHAGIEWGDVQARLTANPEKLAALNVMESTGGEPDVVGHDEQTGEYIFYDCVAESPGGRRNICYDQAGQEEREKKGIYPAGSAVEMAADMGIELLTEAQYRRLQQLGEFDTKTSSWVATPDDIRERGGALFCDRRFGHVFLYHNGAASFYGARGFRGALRV